MLRPGGCHRFFHGGSGCLFGCVRNAVASHQQPVGVDAKRRAGHQRHQVLAVLDLQQAGVCRQYSSDIVHLICQRIAQHMDVKRVAHCKLVDVRKQLGTRHAAVGRQHRVGAAAAHWQGCSYHMTHGFLQRVRARSVLHWQIYVDLGNVDVAHDTAHGKLLGIRQGRGRCPSLSNSCAGQHGIILLCCLPLGGQLGFVGVFDGGGVGGFYVRVVFLTQKFSRQRIKHQPQRCNTASRRQ